MCVKPLSPIIVSDEYYEHDVVAPHEHAKETYFHMCLLRDSRKVQMDHNVNDDEMHEENPHLESYLIPHHSIHHKEQPDTESDKHEAAGQESTARNDCYSSIAGKEVRTERECCTQETRHVSLEKPKPMVRFGTVLVRDYDIILGDHPCCSYGPPLTIDWDYLEYEPLDVNEYEFHHHPRKNLRTLKLNYYQRKYLLSGAGYTEADFELSKKQIDRTKSNRKLTRMVANCYPLLKVEDAVESAFRKFKRSIKYDERCLTSNFGRSISMPCKTSLLFRKKVHNAAAPSEKRSQTSLHSCVSGTPSYQ